MSVMTITAESLSKQLQQPVPEMYVMIAKNSVAGLDSVAIADLLGATREEIDEIGQEQLYKDVRLVVSTAHAQSQTDTDFGWDDIESAAVKRLAKRVEFENDTESLLKIAAVANKAQRRNTHKQNVLDPSQGSARVPLTLTRRITERLSARGEQVREEVQQISVLDGSAKNPSFEDIDQLLGVSRRPAIAKEMPIHTGPGPTPDFDVDELVRDFKG